MSSAFALWWAALILELKKRKKWDFQIKLTQAVVHYETGRRRLKASCSIRAPVGARSQAARAERRAALTCEIPLACLIELWREAPRCWRCNSAVEPCRTVTPHSQCNSATAAELCFQRAHIVSQTLMAICCWHSLFKLNAVWWNYRRLCNFYMC